MDIIAVSNLSYKQNFGFRPFAKIKKSPITVLKYPSSSPACVTRPESRKISMEELLADREKHKLWQRHLQKNKNKSKGQCKNKTLLITELLFTGVLLSAAIFGITRNAKLVTKVMNKYSSFRETKGIQDSTLYVSGKLGEPLKDANDNLQLGISNLCKKVSNTEFRAKKKAMNELSKEGLLPDF